MSSIPNFCPSCGTSTSGGGKFCVGCGVALASSTVPSCQTCSAELAEGAAFCTACGTKAGATASSAAMPTAGNSGTSRTNGGMYTPQMVPMFNDGALLHAPIGPPNFAHFSIAVGKCYQKFAKFSGRASLGEYWWFYLFYVLTYFIMALAYFVNKPLGGLFALAWLIGVGIPMLAVQSRRCHDAGRSAWNALWVFTFFGAVYYMIIMGRPSQVGANRFGEPESLD